MKLDDELAAFIATHRGPGSKVHDLHHLITGFASGRVGEAQLGAWELGTGSLFVAPRVAAANIAALSAGLLLSPRSVWLAYRWGCRSRNLYPRALRRRLDAGAWPDVAALRQEFMLVDRSEGPLALQAALFGAYAACALALHAVLALPQAMARRLRRDAPQTGF